MMDTASKMSVKTGKRNLSLGSALALFLLSAGVACAQVEGPVAPPPKFEVKRLPSEPVPPAPPLPVEEIIRRFTQNEEIFKRAYDAYSFQQTIRVQEQGEANAPGGEFNVTGEFFTKPDGKRYERIIKPPVSTLHRTSFSLEDVQVLARLPLFVLTADELPHYNLTYEGQQKLDELNTFVFRVKPKQVERQRRFFEGVVWVDDRDFAIVKSFGQFVIDIANSGDNDGGTQLPFTMFEIYRENFQQKFWFPTYIRSDDFIKAPKSDIPIHLVIRSTGFQPPNGAAPANPPVPASPSKPPSAN
jgi:hypothetical protein